MKFFRGVRPSGYFQGARLRLDKKTGVRSWNLTFALTLEPAHVEQCAEVILSNYQQIDAEQNRCSGIDISENPPVQRVSFFKLRDIEEPVLVLGHWEASSLRMTKVEGLVELWVTLEHVNSDSLHGFVKDYAFTRLWLEFIPNREAPEPSPEVAAGEAAGSAVMNVLMDALEHGTDDPELADAIDRMVSVTDDGPRASLSITSAGRTVKVRGEKKATS